MIKSILFSACFLLFLSTNNYAQEVPSWLYGHWEGIGYQAPTNSAWNIDLKCLKEKNSFSINYPSLYCNGHWELLESEINRLVFVERITEGLDKCDNNVKVVVTYIDNQYISVAYFLPDYYDNVVASGVLKKKKKSTSKL